MKAADDPAAFDGDGPAETWPEATWPAEAWAPDACADRIAAASLGVLLTSPWYAADPDGSAGFSPARHAALSLAADVACAVLVGWAAVALALAGSLATFSAAASGPGGGNSGALAAGMEKTDDAGRHSEKPGRHNKSVGRR